MLIWKFEKLPNTKTRLVCSKVDTRPTLENYPCSSSLLSLILWLFDSVRLLFFFEGHFPFDWSPDRKICTLFLVMCSKHIFETWITYSVLNKSCISNYVHQIDSHWVLCKLILWTWQFPSTNLSIFLRGGGEGCLGVSLCCEDLVFFHERWYNSNKGTFRQPKLRNGCSENDTTKRDMIQGSPRLRNGALCSELCFELICFIWTRDKRSLIMEIFTTSWTR